MIVSQPVFCVFVIAFMDVEEGAGAAPVESSASLKDAATAFYKKGAYGDAVKTYARALAALGSPPSDAVAAAGILTNRAAALVMLKAWAAASSDCADALALEPTNAKAAMRKAAADVALGDPEASIALYSGVLAEDPTNIAAKKDRLAAQVVLRRLGEARGAAAAGDHEKVASTTALLVDSCPASHQVKLMRATSLLALNRLQEALVITTDLVSGAGGIGPDAAPVYILRAKILNYQVSKGRESEL